MQDFQDRRRWKKMVYSKITIIALCIVALLMFRNLWVVYNKNQVALAENEKSASKLVELEQQKKELATKVKWLSTERGQEEAIRQNFSVVKEGEKVILVVEGTNGASSTPPKPKQNRLLEIIKNIFNI